MQKARLYIWTLMGISLIVLLVGLMSFRYFYSSAKTAVWKTKMANAQRESREVGRLLEQQLQSGLASEKVIQNLQLSILNTDVQSEYLCMYNQKGVELCNPNPALVGITIDTSDSKVKRNEEYIPFSELLKEGKSNTAVRNFPSSRNRTSEIVSVYPVIGTDWMVATHANISLIQSDMDDLFRQFLLCTFLMVIFIVGLCYLLIHLIYRKYQQAADIHIASLNQKLNELNAINIHLKSLQEHFQVLPPNLVENEKDVKRKRIVTYDKNELISIDTIDISWIYLNENTVILSTYLQKNYMINGSLDDLMNQLDKDIFYRINRQYILNINAIKSILLYGKNQLEIIAHPSTPTELIISKNKVADFKKWLDR